MRTSNANAGLYKRASVSLERRSTLSTRIQDCSASGLIRKLGHRAGASSRCRPSTSQAWKEVKAPESLRSPPSGLCPAASQRRVGEFSREQERLCRCHVRQCRLAISRPVLNAHLPCEILRKISIKHSSAQTKHASHHALPTAW